VTDFEPQFHPRLIPGLAARYEYEDDEEVITIGAAASQRGYYTLEEFRTVCRWKTKRSQRHVLNNSRETVEEQTRIALSEESTERERMRALRSLNGVGLRTASALLHLADAERWPILDVRALHALGVKGITSYSFKLWSEYVPVWLDLKEQAAVGGRILDRSLWQWSRDNRHHEC
jgi:thermostable 8-oxoguanine DNA glycosylase